MTSIFQVSDYKLLFIQSVKLFSHVKNDAELSALINECLQAKKVQLGVQRETTFDVNLNGTDEEIAAAASQYYLPIKNLFPPDECISKVVLRPIRNVNLNCHVSSFFQCMEAFYPLILAMLSKIVATPRPASLETFLKILEEVTNEPSEELVLQNYYPNIRPKGNLICHFFAR